MVATLASEAPAFDVDTLIGCRLGSFQLLRHLGTGAMGSVFLAQHAVVGSRVAVKLLHPALSGDPVILQRFQDESRAVNLIGHSNIRAVHELGHDGRLHYLVMEYLDGKPLSQAKLPMKPEQAIPVLTQLCDALGAAHQRGVVHRDLKPDNVMLLEQAGGVPLVKLMDFGTAKLLQDAGGRTGAGHLMGTPSTMAPEQFNGGPIDGRADLYALGVLSYLLATGELPFEARSIPALMRAHLEEPPVPPASRRPGVDPKWSEITMRALAKRPEDRYQDAEAFRAELLSVLDPVVDKPAPRLTLVPAPAPSPSRPALKVDVTDAGGVPLPASNGMELSMDGIFLASPGFAPSLFSMLRLAIHGPGGDVVRLSGEVVRSVSAARALAWGMSEGVGVQFSHCTEEQKRALATLLRGEVSPRRSLAATFRGPAMRAGRAPAAGFPAARTCAATC
ncbi:MAG TPA: serine/threonine-protein kinase [Myxococcaceae bacterium]|jgi:serine/threonine-protein kinase